MKSKSTAFLLTLLGFLGIAGIQYFYIGKISKGLLWLLTAGLCGLGTLVNVFTITSEVQQHNTTIELTQIRKAS